MDLKDLKKHTNNHPKMHQVGTHLDTNNHPNIDQMGTCKVGIHTRFNKPISNTNNHPKMHLTGLKLTKVDLRQVVYTHLTLP